MPANLWVESGYVESGWIQEGVTVDHVNRIINVPQAFCTLVSGNVYTLDTNALRLALKDIEDDEEAITFVDTHRHNTEVNLGGVVYARIFEIINGHTVTFEETGTPWVVNLTGSNNNILDVTNLGTVQVNANNSAGLQVVTTGSVVTAQDKIDIAQLVWDQLIASHQGVGSTGEALSNAKLTPQQETDIADIAAKVAQMVFTKANELDVNLKSVTDQTVNGSGTEGDPWGP